jgi:hypothetical protein
VDKKVIDLGKNLISKMLRENWNKETQMNESMRILGNEK